MITNACAECGDPGDEYSDHRQPPLETFPCLCIDCFKGAIEFRVSELEFEIEVLKETLRRATK